MENTLQDFLLEKGYMKVKLKLTKTNHFEIKVSINGEKGLFILDTGASNSCVAFETASLFNLKTKDSKIKVAGAGSTGMLTQISSNNLIKIGKWQSKKIKLVLFDLSHINTALVSHNAQAVSGIIGADILKKTKAVIDYEKKYLFLKLD